MHSYWDRFMALLILVALLAAFAIFLFPSNCGWQTAEHPPKVLDGTIDLTQWQWKRDGIVPLNGQWEFYWQKLYFPQDFQGGELSSSSDMITVPRTWNNHLIADERIPGMGYGTYRLRVLTQANEILGIKLPKIFTAYNFWVNDEQVVSYGQIIPGPSAVIQEYPRVAFIHPGGNTLEIVVQVGNYRHRSGGIAESILIGTDEQITNLTIKNIALDLFLFGCLFIIGFYHLIFFLVRPKDKSALYFSAFCLLISIRTLFLGELFFLYLFPSFNWELAHKIHTLAYYLSVPLFTLLLKSIYPDDVSTKVNKIILAIGWSFSLLVALTPVSIFSYLNPLYQVFTLGVIIYILFIIYTIWLKKRHGCYTIGIGVLILALLTINDITYLSIIMMDGEGLWLQKFITRGNLSSWGLLAFVFAQSIVLARNFLRSFTQVELMTQKYQKLNESLEEKVKDRTQDLVKSNGELELAYQRISQSEKSRRHLVQNISHDLQSPLTSIKGYVEIILHKVVEEPEQQRKYLKRVVNKVDNLSHLVQDLMELSQLEARELKLDFQPLSIDCFTKSLEEKYSWDIQNGQARLQVQIATALQELAREKSYIMADLKELDRVFANLIGNALNHTSVDGTITLLIDLTKDQQGLLIEVADTGKGIPQEDLPYIFERFYKVEKERPTNHQSSGLGLAIAKEIVEYHGGRYGQKVKLG